MKPAPQPFSTAWKTFFHCVEKSRKLFPWCGKLLLGTAAAVSLAWAGAGCASVKAGRLAVTKVVHWKMSASASAEGFGPELAVDGQGDTWWRSGNAEPQWIEVDLGRAAMVCGVWLQWGQPHATAYSVLTSRDGNQWALGHETTAGDGDWDQVKIEPTLVRFLRVRVDAGLQGTGAALCALEIKGLADQPQFSVDGLAEPAAAAMLDGNPATVWRCARPEAQLEIDLRTVKPIGSVRVDWGTNGWASNVVVEISTNRADWTSVGRIQTRTGDFDVAMIDGVRPGRYLRLSFSGGSVENGFEVAGVTLRGAEGAARPWVQYELAASHAPEGVYPDVFRRRQTYWALAGGLNPGDPESLLDEWGTFAPTAQGPTLAPLIFSDGQAWSAHQAEALEHRLGGEGAPLPETTWKLPTGLELRIRALARSGTTPATAWVQYELENKSIMVQTGRLCWVVRPVRLPPPWAGGGLAPIYRIRAANAADGWQELWANDQPLFAVPETALPCGAAAFDNGDVTEYFLRGETPLANSATDAEGLASAAWWLDFKLEPRGTVRRVVAANAQPAAAPGVRRFPWPAAEAGLERVADDFHDEWVDAALAWRNETTRYAPKIARPDAIECLHAQVGWLLGGGDLADEGSGKDTDSILLRVAALLRAGQTKAARQWIERVATGIQSNGWVPAAFLPDGSASPLPGQEGRHASQGQFAFMVMDYFRFTQDAAFLHEQYPALRRALAYLQALRSELEKKEWRLPEEERFLIEGLLPQSPARLGCPVAAHYYADHYWALLGWKEGRAAASLLGLEADAAWADEQYRLLKSSVRRSLRARMDLMAGAWIPASAEEDRLDIAAVALLFWPCEETDLVEPHELQSSLDAFYDDFLLRRQPGWAGTTSSDESQLLVPLAAMGRGDYAREVLYSLLERRQPTGWHTWADVSSSDSRQPGQIGVMPNLKAAATYFTAVRGLAARETDQRLDLFSGAPAEWLQHGDGFQVTGMPTMFGPLDLTGDWNKNRLVVNIGGGAHPPGGYRLWWPRQVAPERVLANGEQVKMFDAQGVDLLHDFKGKIEVFFPFHAPWPRDP
jgi:hypothetical protein